MKNTEAIPKPGTKINDGKVYVHADGRTYKHPVVAYYGKISKFCLFCVKDVKAI